jgi:hypothetical protein
MPLTPDPRIKVLWLGPDPSAAQITEFENRELILDVNSLTPAQEFRFSTAIIFKVNPDKRGRLLNDMSAFASAAADHGLKVIAVSDDDDGQIVISEAVRRIEPLFDILPLTHPSEAQLAESAARHDPGVPEHPKLNIVNKSNKKLDALDELLFRRAFWNCQTIDIQSLDGGRSADVFRVHARFRDLPVCPRPLPFYAKIDYRTKIKNELANYLDLAEQFVPFNSRPNLNHSRCLLASTKGMIVGTFVEQSEPLADLAKRGHANHAIFSLFEEALRGWRLQAYRANEEEVSIGNLYKVLGNIVQPYRMSSKRLAQVFQLGAKTPPYKLIRLAKDIPEKPYRSAPIHGDLHARNVIVRDSDAILIDFNQTRIGPIAADPASLEVALMFSVSDEKDDNTTWRELVDKLIVEQYFKQAPPPADQPLPREWLWNAVRQIRLFALSMEKSPFEYATVLSIYLLRHSTFPADDRKDGREGYRRAYAYVLGERLLRMAKDAK